MKKAFVWRVYFAYGILAGEYSTRKDAREKMRQFAKHQGAYIRRE